MRIAVDLTSLIAKPTGVDRYITGMVSSLLKYHPEHEYFLFINVEDRGRIAGLLEGANARVLSLSR